MDVIVHIGAHRTATTTFQAYLRANAAALAARGIAAWDPWTTRGGLLAGINPAGGRPPSDAQMRRARARIAHRVEQTRLAGMRQLVVSDENMSGPPGPPRGAAALYPDIVRRMARFAEAFDHRITRVALSVRPQDEFWCSMLSYWVSRGRAVPTAAELAALAAAGHRWRDVILALSVALPGVELRVLPHLPYAGRPDLRLTRLTGRRGLGAPMLPPATDGKRRNASPALPRLRRLSAARGGAVARLPGGKGRWCPFDAEQLGCMRAMYGDDLCWLRAGADGLATLIEETGPAQRGAHPGAVQTTRGQGNGIEERHLA
ncbi:hypothetical protein [Roseovarius salis]|uniref:hypothetical protein n=1 Tax=Roseovarius salis TaxID=3376063 RepID=UPI0037C90B25